MVSATRRRLCSIAQELRVVELENLRLRAENDKLQKWQNSAACAALTDEGKYTGDHLTMTGDGSNDGVFRSTLRGQDRPPPPPSQQSAQRRPERPEDRPAPTQQGVRRRQERPGSAPVATSRPRNWSASLSGSAGFPGPTKNPPKSSRPGSPRRGHRSPRLDESPERSTPAMGHGADRPNEPMRYHKAQVRPAGRIPWDRPPPKVTIGKSPQFGKPAIGGEARRPREAPRHMEVSGSAFGSRSTPASPSNARPHHRAPVPYVESQVPERMEAALVAPPEGPGGAPFVLGFVDPEAVGKLDEAHKARAKILEQRRKEKVRQLSRYEPPPRWSPSAPSLSEIEALHGEPVRNTIRCRFAGSLPRDVLMSNLDWESFKSAFVNLLAAVEGVGDKIHASVFVRDTLVMVSVAVQVPGSADKVAAALRESLQSGDLSRKASEKLQESQEPEETACLEAIKEFFCSRVQLMTLLVSERHEWKISDLRNQIVLHGGSSCLESSSFGLDGCGDLVLQMHPRGTRSHGAKSSSRVALHLCAPALDLPTFSFVLAIGTIGSGERWIGPFGRFGSRFVPGGAVCSPEELYDLLDQNGCLTVSVEAVGQHSGSNTMPQGGSQASSAQDQASQSTKVGSQIRVPLSDDAIYKMGLQAAQRQKAGAALKDAEERAAELVQETKALGRGLEEMALRCKEHTDASLVACGLAGPPGSGPAGNLQQQVDAAFKKAEQCKQSVASVLEGSAALKSSVEELRLAGAAEAERVSGIEGIVEQLRAAGPPEIPDLDQLRHQSQSALEQVEQLRAETAAAAPPEIPGLDQLRQQSETAAQQVNNLDGTVNLLKEDVLGTQNMINQELSNHTRDAEALRQEVQECKDLLQQEREQSARALEALEAETARKIRTLEEQAENAAASRSDQSGTVEVEDRIAALEHQISSATAAPAAGLDERDERIAALEAEVLALKELTMATAAAALATPERPESVSSVTAVVGASTDTENTAAPGAQAAPGENTEPTDPPDAAGMDEHSGNAGAADGPPVETAPEADGPSADAPLAAPAPEAHGPTAEEAQPASAFNEEKEAATPEAQASEAADTEEIESLAEDDKFIMDASIQSIIRMEGMEPPGLASSAATECLEDDRSNMSDVDNTLLEEASGEAGKFLSPKARGSLDNELDAALGLLPAPSEATEDWQDDGSDLDVDLSMPQ
eukprot:gnl/MRDRNA2_/MRDRNA2_83142_c0_seq1.p1 gnl/MRDRNA2_/MRDRNA2_83142_c0~~gnl/MRDRNA2_/MRDRNA2_83142_c0_seq1.p1  ORF type:complete len:1192 (-),score=305.13 gnl/MRDRNA2_/MRDRNA2_83142_c0_seq1:129-3704(-)